MKIFLGILFIMFSSLAPAQDINQKAEYILKSNGAIDVYKSSIIDMRINPLKLNAEQKDLLKLVEIEKKLTDTEITSRLVKGFKKTYSELEISEIYKFYKSTAGQKMIFSNDILEKNLESTFSDITKDLELIAHHQSISDQPIVKVDDDSPVSTTKEDGFYTVKNYKGTNLKLRDLQLSEQPQIQKSDLKDINVDKDQLGRNVVNIILTPEGGLKFKKLTENNVGKPIAIILNKKIISAPVVVDVIPNGKIQISGDFSNKLLSEMVKAFNSK